MNTLRGELDVDVDHGHVLPGTHALLTSRCVEFPEIIF